MIKKNIMIINKLGLHARAAAKFVAHASRFASEIEVTKQGHTVNGKSIMGVMMLAARKDTEIEISANGDDEQAAIDALTTLINNYFDEGE